MANEETSARLEALEGELMALREQLNGHGTRLNDNATISENLARLSTDLLVLIQSGNRQADRDRAAFQQETQRIWQYLLGQQRNRGNGDRDSEQT